MSRATSYRIKLTVATDVGVAVPTGHSPPGGVLSVMKSRRLMSEFSPSHRCRAANHSTRKRPPSQTL
jgi:hypothetical protein